MKVFESFRVGKPGYIVEGDLGKETVTECVVTSIGKRYVMVGKTARYSIARFKTSFASDEYLVEADGDGRKRRMFPNLEQAQNYIERRELRGWINNAIKFASPKMYSLDQLRQVKAILEKR